MKFLRSKPFLYFLGLAIAISSYISIETPVAGNYGDAVTYHMNGTADFTPVKMYITRANFDSTGVKYFAATDVNGDPAVIHGKNLPTVTMAEILVGNLEYDASAKGFNFVGVIRENPIMTFAFIPGLGELGRNMLFHVPMSMVAFIAFFIGTIYSILYLIKRKPSLDRSARASSAVGTLFTLLATITGSVWARFSWGTFWNWDTREISIFILLLIYFAYFILRSLLEESEDKKARIAAVYNILAFVSVPFLMFVIPRITQSLHPGGGGGPAPIINTSSTPVHTDRMLANVYWINTLLFTLLFVWMKDLYTRVLNIEESQKQVEE
jgi:heme exporter protein C